MKKPKDIYSVYPSSWGNIQIRKNDDTEINIVAVAVIRGNGQYTTNQSRTEALKMARKIVKILNS